MKGILLALALARGADAATSCVAFSQGATERNVMLPASCKVQIVAQAGAAALQIAMLARMHQKHPTLAKWLGGVQVGAEGVVIAHYNIR